MRSWELKLWSEEQVAEFVQIWRQSTSEYEAMEALNESPLLGHLHLDKCEMNKILPYIDRNLKDNPRWTYKNIAEVRHCLNRAFARHERPIRLESLPWRHELNWHDITLKILSKGE